ncbi:MAG: hypothetical protein GX334_06665 [Firmicutes bacterium]|nr:hypothetical protein [Bacillota bacterium]
MLLQGKKIGFALTMIQLGNITILEEIEKIMIAGAELSIILLDPKAKEEALLERFQNIFQAAGAKIRQKKTLKPPGRAAKAGEMPPAKTYPFLDLLIVVPDSAALLSFLEQFVAENCLNLPLVLVTSLGNKPVLPWGQISALMKKEGVFFVPFGPIELKPEKKGEQALIFSRMDLLTETCAAALEGHQLEPSAWENLSLPH